ncbi:MAG: transglycosylase SLT domain-containing protein [Pseudomonadota bacterium]
MRWEGRRDGLLWTRVALSAVRSHGAPLLSVVPEDIREWCPAYPSQDAEGRAAFWAALISTLSRYESTWDPQAVGGGGLWHGLMQILPSTADLRGCRALTGAALRDGPANLNCAVRIMAITVPRDGAISVKGARRWQGVAADWGPIRTEWMRRDMQRYTKRQVYCRPLRDMRARPRPASVSD